MSLSIDDAARREPRRIALVRDGRERTFADAAASAAGAWRWLEGRGVRRGQDDPVALVAPGDPGTIALLHALIDAAVPVHLVHPRLTADERQELIGRIRPTLVLDDDARAQATRHPADPPDPAPVPATAPADERTLAVVYTSGTAGAPKGVVLSRRAFAAAAAASAANLGWRDDDRWLLDLPLAHVGGLNVVTRCLIARRAVALPGSEPDSVARTIAAIERDRVSLLSVVPTQLRRLLDAEPRWDPPAHLRVILLGGAPAPGPLLAEAADRGWPVLTTYGLTETCSQVATQRPGTVNRGELGAGPPLPGVEVRIREGEIQVRGDSLFSGYAPPTEAAPFLPDGWFATGDRGELDRAGNLHPKGRVDDVIVTGGENVDPLEVEVALRSVPGVRDACVFGVPDPEWGERVAAAVVLDDDASPDAAGLMAALRNQIAAFKLPRALAFVDEIPVNRTGKPDRRRVARTVDPKRS